MISLAPKVCSSPDNPLTLNPGGFPGPLDTCEKLGHAVFAALAGLFEGVIESPHAGAAPQTYIDALEKIVAAREAFSSLDVDGRKNARRELALIRDRIPEDGLRDDIAGEMLRQLQKILAMLDDRDARTMMPQTSLSSMSRYVLQEAIVPFLGHHDVLHLRAADRSMQAKLDDAFAGIELAARSARVCDIEAFRDLLKRIGRLPPSQRSAPLLGMCDAIAGLPKATRFEAFETMCETAWRLPVAERPGLIVALDEILRHLPLERRADGFNALLDMCIELPVGHRIREGAFLVYSNVSCLPSESAGDAFCRLLDLVLQFPESERAAQLAMLAINLYSVDDPEKCAAAFARMLSAARQLPEDLRADLLDALLRQLKHLPEGFVVQ